MNIFKSSILIIFLVLVFSILGLVNWGITTYNYLIAVDQEVKTSWSNVETQYQRRFDLIPGLVEATKGFLKQEQKVFGDIAEARTHYAGTNANTEDRIDATNQLDSALARLMVIIENYPQLNSNETVRGLMDELAGTENRINVARDRYNSTAKKWNSVIKSFPSLIIANIFNYKEADFFKSEEGANKAVKVDLGL